MPDWKFITKHTVVLSIIANNPRITALEIAGKINVTERAARKLIAELYETGYIRKKKEGRRVVYAINSDKPLRQNTHRGVAIGSLLETLGWEKQQEN
ncbi:MAG TPA: winged helix-turn-helix transcriptional regulator [Dehalococcoidia bacterium]|nr:winged helix-turn-helix transcriptional regulator [Dehalococcoidia bacterium]